MEVTRLQDSALVVSDADGIGTKVAVVKGLVLTFGSRLPEAKF